MFQLLELILASPIGVFVFAGLQDALYAVFVLSDCDDCGFNDLGKLLFGWVILAILAGVAISVLLRRSKETGASSSGFVSIRSSDTITNSLEAGYCPPALQLTEAGGSPPLNEGIRSGHERIPRRVAKDPEENQQHEPGPKVNRRNENTPVRLAGDSAAGESQKTVDDKRQRQDHQRIQLERHDWM